MKSQNLFVSVCSASCSLLRFGGAALLLSLMSGIDAHGIGFRIPNQDAEAIARGNAFAATADNPSAIYYNPAGITQIEGHRVQFGVLNYLGLNTDYKSAGATLDTDFEVIPVPQLYYVFSPSNSVFSAGVGIYAPFGLGVEWPDNPAMRPFALESRLQYVTVNPVIAWQPHPTFSVAIGSTLNYSEIMFTRGLASPTADFYKFKGDDFGLGFNVGVLWQPHAQWSFGASYRSANAMKFEGSSSYSSPLLVAAADTEAKVRFPQIVTAGVSFRPTPEWNIEVNVDYTDWNPLEGITLNGTRNLGGGGIFPDLRLNLDWKGSWFYEIGATRRFANGWFASAGYFYCTETATDGLFTPAVPDTNLHVGSAGFGRKGEKWDWAVAGQIIAGPERDIVASPNAPSGSYQLFIPTVSFSVARRF